MKKSKAIKKLLDFYTRKTDLNGRITMEEILNFCEHEIGMLPPAVIKYIDHGDWCYADYHIWEPEEKS